VKIKAVIFWGQELGGEGKKPVQIMLKNMGIVCTGLAERDSLHPMVM